MDVVALWLQLNHGMFGKLPVGAGHIFSRSLALCLKDQQMKRCSLGWVQGTPILEKSLTCSRKVMKKQKKETTEYLLEILYFQTFSFVMFFGD